MITIKNGVSYNLNGWKYISISGTPYERGFAYGYLCAKEFKQIKEMLDFFIYESYGITWDHIVKEVNKTIKPKTNEYFKEFYDEMYGISKGCNSGGTDTNIDEIIAWNFYCSIPYWISTMEGNENIHFSKEGGSPDKCSAFIAVGDYTESGEIVVAHNSFTDFLDGQYSNIILDLKPSKGNRFIMQTSPCWIWSGTDFFITSKGIIGTETTIGGFIAYENNFPVGYRIRKAMQYGNSFDDYISILLDGNSGDYANSWLFGDINTNEIMRIELGLKYNNIERTKNGYFIGFNATYDPRIRNLECVNSGFDDIRRHQGARRVRINDLMIENKGKLNIEIAKNIISDHYDIYLNKADNPCSRTICSHYELDAREYMSQSDRPKPFSPRGALDGIVCDSVLAKQMSFIGRFGNSCGTEFIAHKFCEKNRQWKYMEPYLHDRISHPWTKFGIYNLNNNKLSNKLKPSKNNLKSKKNKTKLKSKSKKSLK
jgi:hypothetical protein